jgi:beta-mannanase
MLYYQFSFLRINLHYLPLLIHWLDINHKQHLINSKMPIILLTGFVMMLSMICQNEHSVFALGNSSAYALDVKLRPPLRGIYNGAFTFGAEEDHVTKRTIINFEKMIGKKLAWAYFSNNWGSNGIAFPEASVRTIHDLGIVPFIRIMPRSNFDRGTIDPEFTLQSIIDGKFDNDIRRWADNAKRVGIPLMLEFGTEVNGDWFPWSGILNGGGIKNGYGDPSYPDGPERFRDAYRHVVNLFRDEGVRNITWCFHVTTKDTGSTLESWNNMKNYYPGDDYVDWIGLSVYGADKPASKWKSFTDILDKAYPELASISNTKPLALFEFGILEDPQQGNKTKWISDALNSLESGRYPRIKAISYWNEIFTDGKLGAIDFRINSSADTAELYKQIINSSFFVSKPKLL